MAEPARPLGTDDADDLRLYLEAAAREPLLTKEEEIELAQTIERGKAAEERLAAGRVRSDKTIRKLRTEIRVAEAARQRFIMANLRLVVSVARKYQGQGLPLLDLIQEGNIGLMRAAELGDLIEEADSEGQFTEVEDALLRQEIGEAVEDLLDERERQVVALRYGLDSGQPLSLRETGKVLGLSGERVRLIEREALRKLRNSDEIAAAVVP